MDWFARPGWLLLVPLAAVGVWLAERLQVRPAGSRAARVVARSLVALLAILAASGARLPQRRADIPCVLAVDVSRSMGGASPELAARAVESLPPECRFGAVAFAAEAAPLRLQDLTARGGADSAEACRRGVELAASSLDRSATDLARGIRAAMGLVGEGRRGAIVLISDGIDTSARGLDQAVAAALECRATGVPIFALAPDREPQDIRVEGVAAPVSIEAGRPVPLTALLSASVPARVVAVALRRPGAEELGRATVALAPGSRTAVAFSDPSPPRGIVRYEVELRAPGGAGALDDGFPENDSAAAAVLVRGPPRVLVVPGGGAAAQILGLAGERFELASARPEELSVSADALAGFSAIVLEDVPRSELSPAAERALADYVSLGGGLLAVGGPRAFGAGGWRDEDVLPSKLPVKVTPSPSEKALVAFLVDASGSMAEQGSPGRSKLEDARDALAAVLPMLAGSDEVALVAFRDVAETLASGLQASRRDELLERLRSLRAEGKTSLEAPLREALAILRARPAAIRSAVMLSDGEPTVETSRERLVGLAREFRRSGFSLHAIGTSPAPAHRELLAELASEGGGVAEFETSFARLSEAMRRALARAAGRFVIPGPVVCVRAGSPGGVLEGLGELPELGAANRTELRPSARPVLAAGSGEPVLAFAEAGSGRSAAFASSLGGSWAGGLESWPGRLRLLTQILREISPPPPDPGLALRPLRDAGGLLIEVAARDTQGAPRNLLELIVELRSAAAPERSARVVRAEQVALGTYRASVPAELSGERTLTVRVLEAAGRRELLRAPLVVPPEPETLRTGRDLAALAEIARASGGRLLAEPAGLAEALSGLRQVDWLDGSSILAVAALAGAVLEVALRILASRGRGPSR